MHFSILSFCLLNIFLMHTLSVFVKSVNFNNNKTICSLDSSQTSVQDDPSDDQLINLDAPASKFDQMTLDDLNDDDFDPRAGDQTGMCIV